MIEIVNLQKSYGQKSVLKNISLTIPKGQAVALLGPNGAGKSTLLKLLALLTKPNAGQIVINDMDNTKNEASLKGKIGLISHNTFLYPDLSAYENLKFYGDLYNVQDLDNKITGLLNKVGLKLVLFDPVYTFSRGMLQRLAIARALIHDPQIVLLDEPFTGLDQHGIAILEKLIIELKEQGKIVIMVTHSFEDGIKAMDRILIINRGTIISDINKIDIPKEDLKEFYLTKVAG